MPAYWRVVGVVLAWCQWVGVVLVCWRGVGVLAGSWRVEIVVVAWGVVATS